MISFALAWVVVTAIKSDREVAVFPITLVFVVTGSVDLVMIAGVVDILTQRACF